MNDLRRLAKKAKESLARDGTSWDDSVRLSSSAEEEDFAAACDPQTILALLAEVDRLTDYIAHEPSALTIRLAERARIREAVEADLQVSLRRYEEARSARQWTRADRYSGAIRALEDVLAAIEGEK